MFWLYIHVCHVSFNSFLFSYIYRYRTIVKASSVMYLHLNKTLVLWWNFYLMLSSLQNRMMQIKNIIFHIFYRCILSIQVIHTHTHTALEKVPFMISRSNTIFPLNELRGDKNIFTCIYPIDFEFHFISSLTLETMK